MDRWAYDGGCIKRNAFPRVVVGEIGHSWPNKKQKIDK